MTGPDDLNPSDPHPVAVSQTHVHGIISLIFWSVTLIVTVNHVLLVLQVRRRRSRVWPPGSRITT